MHVVARDFVAVVQKFSFMWQEVEQLSEIKRKWQPGVAAHACHLSSWEAEVGESPRPPLPRKKDGASLCCVIPSIKNKRGKKEKKNYCLQYYHHSRFLWDLSLHPLPTSLIPSPSLSLSKWFISRLKSLQEQKTFAHEIGIELCNLSISIQR